MRLFGGALSKRPSPLRHPYQRHTSTPNLFNFRPYFALGRRQPIDCKLLGLQPSPTLNQLHFVPYTLLTCTQIFNPTQRCSIPRALLAYTRLLAHVRAALLPIITCLWAVPYIGQRYFVLCGLLAYIRFVAYFSAALFLVQYFLISR